MGRPTTIRESAPVAPAPPLPSLDPVRMAVVQSRLEGAVGAMMHTLMRSARSGILGVAKDFSCCILTADDEVVASSGAIPIHVMQGPDMMSKWMKKFHPGLKRGDAFLHNSPYHGNSHAADWSILVPVIDYEGRHRFTVLAKAHQGDCGNGEPTTYAINARDVYEEGALIWPCVKAQENYQDNEDLIRTCQMRIRVPEQWWGDYLALVGSARIGERRLLELIDDLGADVLASYGQQLFDESEQRMIDAIRQLPKARRTAVSVHDPFPRVPDGVPIKVTVDVDPDDARITVDLRDNPDCLPVGINLSEACSRTAALIGVFNSVGHVDAVGHPVVANAGAFRRVDVLVRENCCVGIPRHPHSVSAATTNLQDRVANATARCFSDMMEGIGLADFGAPVPPSGAVISGTDPRSGKPFINQLQLAAAGGPGGPSTDGWVTAYSTGAAGMMYKDSVEIDEVKHPIRVLEQRILSDTCGDGRHRGAPSALVRIQAVNAAIEFMINSDGTVNYPRGVRGGHDGMPADQWVQQAGGGLRSVGAFHRETISPGDVMVSVSSSGGGYGLPTERPIAMVVRDVREGWLTAGRAAEVYGVVLDEDLRVDEIATLRMRREIEAWGPPPAVSAVPAYR
ncbi:MAG: hydantoinase B/oxoprolinase family protein [Solirubrobacteraceae bacterium]|nr:hydantoinase B/oxoprolinase family protein [Solirubrobacteraceae bacterium]